MAWPGYRKQEVYQSSSTVTGCVDDSVSIRTLPAVAISTPAILINNKLEQVPPCHDAKTGWSIVFIPSVYTSCKANSGAKSRPRSAEPVWSNGRA